MTRKVGSIVKWEGIVVDPIGAIMAVLIFQAAIAGDWGSAGLTILATVFYTLLIGGVFALVLSKVIEILLRKHLIPDFLHSVFIISIITVAYSASNYFVKESGLLTVTIWQICNLSLWTGSFFSSCLS